MLQLRSVVIFDNFVVLVSRFFLVSLYTCLLLCNRYDRYILFLGLLYGDGCPVGG